MEKLLERASDLERLIAYNRVAQLVEGNVTPETIKKTQEEIERDIQTFRELVNRR